MKRITILLVEDHTIVRQGLRSMLELDPGLHIIGEAEDGRQAVAMANRLHPDVVLMDIAMPHLNGLEATRQIRKALDQVRVMILSAHNEEAYVNSAKEAGAAGFLLKQSSADEVGRAIREIHLGCAFLNTAAARSATASSGRAVSRRMKAQTLTSREMEVLQLVAEGKANKGVASELGIGIKTVEKHREHLMKKLGIHDTAGLTRYAIGAGIIESVVQVTIL
jgi:DNA-binding NarL/FixJ family response regulator